MYINESMIYLKGVLNMAQINIRIDDNLKVQAETLFAELGLNISTAFNVFIRQSIRKVVFHLKLPHRWIHFSVKPI